ncbi:MAG: histidine kinase [Melioribacteraceae bacterium]|nr:histidine kinase [Melioribacteraceae bacterium]
MKFRISNILVVSSDYDYYIFEEDGRLYELLRNEYKDLNLSHAPEFTHISRGDEALEELKSDSRYDMILVTLHIEGMQTVEFARKVVFSGLKIPIILLAYENKKLHELYTHYDISLFERIFIWQGDFRVIIGIIKYLEDKYNLQHDSDSIGVQSIILIEDNIKFYSSYVPLIYTELLKQSRYLISDGVNLSQKFLRMRARPKILLCSTYEEAKRYFDRYKDTILGVISDIDFKHKGVQDPKAGLKFCKYVKENIEDIPVLLQSNDEKNREAASNMNAAFLLKESRTLHQDLRTFMQNYFSFGDFIFRNSKGEEVGRARNLGELETQLHNIPAESIIYHAEKNHFSNWLKARTEFWLAHELRPQRVSDFNNIEEMRQALIDVVGNFRRVRHRRLITDFDKKGFRQYSALSRIGGGSLGGKARGLGFVNYMLADYEIRDKFKDAQIFVPPSVILATDIFDQFIEENDLYDFALNCDDDNEIIERFCHAEKFPFEVIKSLNEFLEIMTTPIAVRSSSLLEDSQGYPFAGVYDTLMLPNSHQNSEIRLLQLLSAVKRIFASIYLQKSKTYIKMTSYRLEEEKMAVIVQEMIGAKHGDVFYPELSGVAKSFNYYPIEPLHSSDGIASVAMGQGKTITDGGSGVRFCPRYPTHIIQFSTIEDVLEYGQKEFFALKLDEWDENTRLTEDIIMKSINISEAEIDGTLTEICSTYSPDNSALYDGVSRPGVRVFTLAPILKFNLFPLAEIIDLLLIVGSKGMGSPIEIEFAVNLSTPPGTPKQFALLQMRPLVKSSELEVLDISGHIKKRKLCSSNIVLGNGVIDDIYDIVYVDQNNFSRAKSNEVVLEIANINGKLVAEKRPYLLIGLGRWGTLDPWLGIPVTWEQISGARTIVETNFRDINVTPSQGSHFFQNLTSFKIGYFTINGDSDESFIDWDWLHSLKPYQEKKYTKHVRLENPITVKINGRENKGIILKPDK